MIIIDLECNHIHFLFMLSLTYARKHSPKGNTQTMFSDVSELMKMSIFNLFQTCISDGKTFLRTQSKYDTKR